MGIGISAIQYDLEFGETQYDISIVLLYVIFISTLLLQILTVLRYEAQL